MAQVYRQVNSSDHTIMYYQGIIGELPPKSLKIQCTAVNSGMPKCLLLNPIKLATSMRYIDDMQHGGYKGEGWAYAMKNGD